MRSRAVRLRWRSCCIASRWRCWSARERASASAPMTRFSVWAPGATRVDVDLQGDRVPMSPDSGGWWWAEVPEAEPGDRYRFVLDGGEPLPDPRSAWQPDGIDGPSAIYDHAHFPWTHGAWKGAPLASAVVFEVDG